MGIMSMKKGSRRLAGNKDSYGLVVAREGRI